MPLPTGWDFYMHGQPPGLTPKETRFYEALPGIRSEAVPSVSVFPKQRVSHDLSESRTSECGEDLPGFLTDKKMADGRTCKRVVLIGLGTHFYDQNSKAQQEALSDQFLRLAAKFTEVGFLWNADPGFVRGRASFLALPQSDSDSFPLVNMEVRSYLPQKKILSSPALDAFISHGGINSVNEALARGVPPLVLANRRNPDAPIAAEMLAERGWGLNLERVLGGTQPHSLKSNGGHTGVEGHWLDLGMRPGEQQYSEVTSQYAKQWPALEKFFSDFIVNEGTESVSGRGYTLAHLRKTLDNDLFGVPGVGVPAGEEQLTYAEAANKLLAAIEKERPTVDVWPVGGAPPKNQPHKKAAPVHVYGLDGWSEVRVEILCVEQDQEHEGGSSEGEDGADRRHQSPMVSSESSEEVVVSSSKQFLLPDYISSVLYQAFASELRPPFSKTVPWKFSATRDLPGCFHGQLGQDLVVLALTGAKRGGAKRGGYLRPTAFTYNVVSFAALYVNRRQQVDSRVEDLEGVVVGECLSRKRNNYDGEIDRQGCRGCGWEDGGAECRRVSLLLCTT